MNFIPLKYDNENYDAVVFFTCFEHFSGFYSFSALLEDVL